MANSLLIAFQRTALECAGTMQESSAFIEQELQSLDLAEPYRQAINRICEAFTSNWFDIRTEVDELSELQAHAYSPMIKAGVERIYQWLGESLPELDRVVTALSSAAKDDAGVGVAYVLVAESATNVLNAFSSVTDAHASYLAAYVQAGGR